MQHHVTLTLPPQALIVSVQASQGEPLYPSAILEALCHSVVAGGAMGLRIATPSLIAPLKQAYPTIPVIAITKPEPLPTQPAQHVYITATLPDALYLAESGADIIALDATDRPRPDGTPLATLITTLKQQYPHIQVMADIDTVASAQYAVACGVDILSTTLAGYTAETQHTSPKDAPDFALLQALVEQFPSLPVIAEGRFWHPAEVTRAFALGATAVVVGSAITRPHHITARFVKACKSL